MFTVIWENRLKAGVDPAQYIQARKAHYQRFGSEAKARGIHWTEARYYAPFDGPVVGGGGTYVIVTYQVESLDQLTKAATEIPGLADSSAQLREQYIDSVTLRILREL